MPDLDANHYRQHSSTQYTHAHEILKTIDFRGDETLFDVGCAEGRMSAQLSKCLPHGHVVGIDPSPAMIELARQSFPKESYPNLDFKKSDAESVRSEQSADIILIMNTLHWIRDSKRAIYNMAAALRPGGTLFILTYPQESPYWRFLEETTEEWLLYRERSAFKTILTAREYRELVEEAGLEIQSSSLEEKIATYATREELKDYIKGWLNCYLTLPEELTNDFLEKAVERASVHSLNKKRQEIQIPYCKLVISAQKRK